MERGGKLSLTETSSKLVRICFESSISEEVKEDMITIQIDYS